MHTSHMIMRCNECGFVGPSITVRGTSRCARCDVEFSATSKATIVHKPASDSVDSCVKCLHKQAKGSFACEKCGLRFALAAQLPRNHRFDGLPNSPVAEALRKQWGIVESIPNDKDKHFKFIDLCQVSGHIDFAGHCYRIALQNAEPPERELWQVYQKRVLQRAMLNLGSPSRTHLTKSRLVPLFMLVLGGVLILGLAYLYFHWSQSSAVMLQNGL